MRPTNPALTVEQLDHSGRTSHEVDTAGFYDDDWDVSVRLVPGRATRGGAEIVEVLPGWFFRPDGTGRARRTLVLSLGSDEAITGLCGQGAGGGRERDYNVGLEDK